MEETQRQSQISAELKRLLGPLLSEIEFPGGCLVTITRITVSRDLGNASVFLSIIPDHCWNGVKNVLGREKSQLQKEISGRLPIRRTPRLHFKIDLDRLQARHMEDLLDELASNE